MRVSNTMLTNNFLNNLNKNLEKMMKQQTQIATNKRITALSDDPVGAVTSMNAQVKLERIEQYQKNISTAQSWVGQTESAVLELNEVVKSAYESAISSSNDYLTAEDKQATAAMIGELKEHVISLGNSKAGDRYLFGGFNTINPPFQLDSGTGDLLFNGVDMANPADPALIAEGSQVIQFEIAFNIRTDISINGTELFGTGEDNIYKILDDFYDALQADAPASELSEFADKLQSAQSRLLNTESKIGGKTNRLDLVMTRHDDDFLNYTTIKSNIEDVDQAEAIMKFKMTESVYLASLQIASDIIQPTLVDFLK